MPEPLFNKEALAQVFSCDFCEISKNTFFTEHFRATASVFEMQFLSFSRRKYPKFLPAGPFFLVLSLKCLSECPNSKKTLLPSQFLVTRLY